MFFGILLKAFHPHNLTVCPLNLTAYLQPPITAAWIWGLSSYLLMFTPPAAKRGIVKQKELIMRNMSNIDPNWQPLCRDSLFEIPTDHPVICMEHTKTKQHAYYDVKLERLLSEQEAFDVMRGVHW